MEYLSREQIKDVLDFSQGMYLAENYGIYSPWLSNQMLRNLNNNPKIPTLDKIKQALQSYKESGADLTGYTEFMQNYDMIFKRTLYSYANTLAFDLSITCINAYTQADYQSKEYQEDKKRVYDFLDAFNYRKEFRQVVVELLARETYFTWFRKTKWGNKGMKFALQIMPQDYCMLTGYWEKGLLYDLDMAYYLQPGVDLDGFDPSIKKLYEQVFSIGANPINYRPSNPLNERTGKYAYWAQTSPMNGSWAFKMNPNNFTQVPYLAPFLKDAILNDEVAALQYDKDMAAAYGILAGEFRLFDSDKSQKANQFAIDPVAVGGFTQKVTSALKHTVRAVAMPTENTRYYQFTDANADMYKDQLATSSGVGSGVSRVIYSSDRMSNAEIEAGITDQYNTMRPLYYQFSNFMDFFANQLTKHYKFHFEFDGCSYKFDREARFDRLMKLADKGMMLGPSAFASAMGIPPQQFERQLQESKWSGWSDLFQLPLNANTMSGGSDEGGRPEVDDSDLSESGEMNRDADGEL